MLKIAMFDEGTAILKAAARRNDAPDQGYWLTHDADGAQLPSDWYLRLAAEITATFTERSIRMRLSLSIRDHLPRSEMRPSRQVSVE